MKTIYINKLLIMLAVGIVLFASCGDAEEECTYAMLVDCDNLELNIGDLCDSNSDGNLNGTVNEACECEPNSPVINNCPGFIENGDFEILTGNVNAVPDNDINLATGWKPLWQSGSLADLFDNTTTNFGASCFQSPTPSTNTFAGMWVENHPNPNASATYREGFFNELVATINQNSGVYTLTFDYANMSGNCGATNNVKVGVYGVNFPIGNPLPTNPTGVGVPSNLDLFGAANTVLLGEITLASSTTNAWTSVSISIDTSTLSFPVSGVNHIMITNSHIPFEDFGRIYAGFDNFCLTNGER